MPVAATSDFDPTWYRVIMIGDKSRAQVLIKTFGMGWLRIVRGGGDMLNP